MSTTPTNQPVPSEKPQDLKFNAGKIDEFVTSMAQQYIDRFGNAHYTIEGLRWVAQQAIAAFGYITMDSFEDGNTLTLPNQVLRLEATGEYYRWDGAFPKAVPAGSTPDSTGGIGVGAWLSVGDATLRGDLALPSGAGIIGTESGYNVQEELNTIKTRKIVESISDLISLDTAATEIVTVLGFHVGSVISLDGGVGGGTFKWSSSTSKTSHNGGTIIDPDRVFPATWDAAGKNSWFTAAASGSGCWLRVKDYDCLLAEFFGALSWNPGDTYDSTIEFQKTADVAGRGGLWRWHRRHRTTSFVQIPNKQTFGSFKQITSIYSEIFNPTNFQGVHVGVDPSLINTVTSAVFYDADSGEAFRCGEGAIPSTFLLYGRGYSTTGMNLSVALPSESAYLNTSGIRHGKYIKPENVTVVLFKYPFDSNPWDSVSLGDYYTTYTNCVQQYCFCMWRVSSAAGEPTFNTKHINSRAYVNKIVENNFSIKDAVFIGGSIEGFNTPTTVRESAAMSFKGTYFESHDPTNTVMFNVIGWCALNFENCLIYMNYVTRWVTTGGTSQTAGVTGISVTAHGNTWRKTDNASSICFEFDGVVRKSYGLYGDIFHLGGTSTLGYYAGAIPTGIYAAPITLAGA
jgi:hypothetical protein|nr:MAG TPA: tail spike [Caudoviricetes sp.]